MNRVFTQSKNISYSDYNKYLSSKTIFKNSLTHGKNYYGNNLIIRDNVYTNFSDYKTFLGVSEMYFNHFVEKKIVKTPFTINEGKKSYVLKENNPVPELKEVVEADSSKKLFTNLFINADNINCCVTTQEKAYQEIINHSSICEKEKFIIYPYGKYEGIEDKLIFPCRLIIPNDKCSNICPDLPTIPTINEFLNINDDCKDCKPKNRLFI